MFTASVVAPVLPTPAVSGPPRTAVAAAPVTSRPAPGSPAPWPQTAPQTPVARTRLTTVAGLAGPCPAVEVTLTGVPSVLEQIGGFPSGPVDGYPHPTTYRLVLDSPDGPLLILPVGLWGDQPAAVFADVARRGFDVDVKAGSRRVGRHQYLNVRRHGSASC